jgi:hypothetical protein
MDLETVAAHLEIQQVLYRYCRGVDRGDAAMIAGVYHPDGVDHHGPWKGLGRDFAPVVVGHLDKMELASQHHITNVLIELDGDEADVESYYIAYQAEATDAGPGHSLTCGRYLDRFAKRNGVWLIAHRRVVIDVSRDMGVGPLWSGMSVFPTGGRREADPSASMFRGAAKPAT